MFVLKGLKLYNHKGTYKNTNFLALEFNNWCALMSLYLKNFKVFVAKYPIVRGMVSYSLIWPTSSIIQQTFEGKRWGKFKCILIDCSFLLNRSACTS